MLLRRVLAISAGAVVFIVVFVLFDALSSVVFPTPSGFDPNNPDAISEHLANTPAAALAVVLVGATVAAFAGSYVTAMLIGASAAMWGFVTGAVSLIGAMANAVASRHPGWFLVAAPLGVTGASVLGVWLIMRQRPKQKRASPARKT